MKTSRPARRGAALVLTMTIVLLVSGLVATLFSLSMISGRRSQDALLGLQALYTAEAGAALFIQEKNGGGPGTPAGSFSGGDYAVTEKDFGTDGLDNDADGDVDEGDEKSVLELEILGRHAGTRRTLRILLSRTAGGVYWNALFAGNRSGDPSYALALGGRGKQADEVYGNVYSAGGMAKTGDAVIKPYRGQDADDFTVMVAGESEDSSSQDPALDVQEGTQSELDLGKMNYETRHDVNVRSALAERGRTGFDDAGGTAVQIMNPDDPAHIFRMNPSDRSELWSKTAKDDYFLEDPTAPVRLDPNWNGSDAYALRLSTGAGNNVIYYVDGNLWLNNRHTYSFKFHHPETRGVKVTFVVKGNIYFGDNLFYTNINKDAAAFIAMKDPAVPDSGNVYFGDPLYGTTRHFEGYMYADNNFYDNNLGTPSSMTTTVFGNMTAGNQVQIRRDLSDGQHVKLRVEFDPKAREGQGPPGLPPNKEGPSGDWRIVFWKQIP